MYRFVCAALLLTSLILSACDAGVESAEVFAADYDQSCSQPADCVLVTEGDYCGCRVCPNAAISATDLQAFEDDAAAARDSCSQVETACGSLDEERAHQAASCGDLLAVCDSGTCAAKMPEDITGPVVDVVDRACEDDSDCTTVLASFDNECGCKVAVSRDGAEVANWISTTQSGNDSCACDADTIGAECVQGTCELTADECEVTAWRSEQCE